MPALLSIALLAILYRIPEPGIQVNQPFKVEFLLSLFLIAFLAVVGRRVSVSTYVRPVVSVAISWVIFGFIVWSLLSAFWASSHSGVAHHTLLWSVYLIFFLILTDPDRAQLNTGFITTTFFLVAIVLGFLCLLDYASLPDWTSLEGDIRIRYGKYSELLATISPVLWAVAIYTRNRRRMLFALCVAVVSWVTVMLSLSKGAFIAGVIGFVVFFISSGLFSVKRFRKRVLVCAAIWLAATIAVQAGFSFLSSVPSTSSYITGAADPTRSTSAMRVFVWKVGRQMASDHPLMGVGADNFGLAFNKERIRYREKNPDNPAEEIAEDYIVERAHNEPLQVLTELGVVGLALFLLPIGILLFYCLNEFRIRRRFSPLLCAALAGMTAFIFSSMVSSFSFRAAQNGVAFFMVFALAVNEIGKRSRRKKLDAAPVPFLRTVYALCFVPVLLLIAFCSAKALAEYNAYQAERVEPHTDLEKSYFQTAVVFDPEYAGAYLSHALRTDAEGDPATAAQMTRKTIDHGLGIAPIYSQLAKEQERSGNADGALSTYRQALSIYPRSVYLRTEFVILLEGQGQTNEAREQSAIARSIDLRQANGWYAIIKDGSVAAFYRSKTNPDIAAPAELLPPSAVRQYVDKIPEMGAPENPQ